MGERGAGLKRGEDVRRWPENARSWARPRRGNVGERLGTHKGMTGGVRELERERARAEKKRR
jgi:hypothetical protein